MPLCLENLNRPNETLLAHLPYQIFLMISREYNEMESMKIEYFFSLLQTANWCKSEETKNVFERTLHISDVILKLQKAGRGAVDLAMVGKAIKLVSHLLTPTEKKAFVGDLQQLSIEISKRLEKKTPESKNIDLTSSSTMDRINASFSAVHNQNTLKKRLVELPIEIFYLVANADGDCDKKERRVFIKILKKRKWSESRITDAFFPHTVLHYEELEKKQITDQIKPNLREIQKTMKIVMSVFKPQELHLFRMDLFKLAMEIASASGGFLGISKIADKEQEVLNNLRFAFRGGK